jgi:hypothetical protein
MLDNRAAMGKNLYDLDSQLYKAVYKTVYTVMVLPLQSHSLPAYTEVVECQPCLASTICTADPERIQSDADLLGR